MTDPQGEAPREFNPRHRIMGAIVLVSLAVIFVPMVLEDRPAREPVAEQSMEIPGKDSRLFVSKITPIDTSSSEPVAAAPVPPPPTEGARAPEPSPAPHKEEPPAKEAIKEPAGKPSAQTPRQASEVPAVASEKTAKAAPAEAWAVRVGTFSQRQNALRVASRLKAAGFEAKTERLNANGRQVTRVWLGPLATREEAVHLQTRILKKTGQEGFVVSYP